MTNFISAAELLQVLEGVSNHTGDEGEGSPGDVVVLDCRFSLFDPCEGRDAYAAGHIPGAHFLDLNTDMCAPLGKHGGRHPLPNTEQFAARLAQYGIDAETAVVLYDDSKYVFAARCWWMMRSLGYRSPKLLSGGYAHWIDAGGAVAIDIPTARPCPVPNVPKDWPYTVDRDGLRSLQREGAILVDAREGPRYRGEHEPIDPVAGHIPGAENRPWQNFIDDTGNFLTPARLADVWGQLASQRPLVMYCGSGVSACVNILSLQELGREDVWLYGGSWSDWCSYL